MGAEKQSPPIKRGPGGKRPGAGRKPGVPNKFTAELKDMILQALSDAGGVRYLKTQAKENPRAFIGLLGRVLPLQVTGAANGAIEVRIVD